jgi:phosphate transport system substrate-binding protein
MMLAVSATVAMATVSGCFSKSGHDSTIRVTGSDTMVNLAQAWAEAYRESHPDISSQVRGGGSGVGIAALCNGTVDIATASRAMSDKETELARKNNNGKEPKEFIVGRDALAIYVHKDNPIDVISIDELAGIYGEGGKITKWEQLGVDNAECSGGQIVQISRQNNSGTYAYFKEAVLGEQQEYKQGATTQSGSADVVALISKTPCALGYSGMGYKTDDVKLLNVSRKKGEAGIEPSVETTLDGSYPISRPLYIYTLGEPTGAVQEFVEWVLGGEGQRIVADVGYVPNPQAAKTDTAAGDSDDQAVESGTAKAETADATAPQQPE